MDNDQVLAAEDAVQHRPPFWAEPPNTNTKKSSTTQGRDAAIAAGGVPAAGETYEDTPLLARDNTISTFGTAEDDGDDEESSSSRGGEPPLPPPATEWPGTRAFAHLPWWRRPSVLWLIPSLLVHTLAFGGILVPKLTLILNLVCRDYYADRMLHDPNAVFAPVHFDGSPNDQCEEAVIQRLASEFSLALSLIAGLVSVVVAPRLGALSDKYGRKRLIAFTGLGGLTNEVATILAVKYPETISVNWLLFGAFLDGLSGTFITAMAITNAYAADCTPPSRRSVAFGWIQGTLFTGIAFGPFLASIIIELTNDVVPVFYTAIAAHAALIPYILFVVPESLTKERQLQAREKAELAGRSSILAPQSVPPVWPEAAAMRLVWGVVTSPKQIVAPLAVLWPTGPGTSPRLRRNLVLLASIDTVMFGIAMGISAVLVYYSRFMFHWSPVQSSNFIAAAALCRVFSLVVVLPLLTRLVRGKADPNNPAPNKGSDALDVWLIRVSIVLDILGFSGYATAQHGAVFFLSGCVSMLGGFGSPTLQGSMTKHAPVAVTGELLGAMGLLHGAARVVAPAVLNLVYARTVEVFPRTVFMVLAIVFTLVLGVSMFLKTHVYIHMEEQQQPDDTQ